MSKRGWFCAASAKPLRPVFGGMKVVIDPMVPKGYVELHDEHGVIYRGRVAFPKATKE